jgi:hypothetical protein
MECTVHQCTGTVPAATAALFPLSFGRCSGPRTSSSHRRTLQWASRRFCQRTHWSSCPPPTHTVLGLSPSARGVSRVSNCDSARRAPFSPAHGKESHVTNQGSAGFRPPSSLPTRGSPTASQRHTAVAQDCEAGSHASTPRSESKSPMWSLSFLPVSFVGSHPQRCP